jgi:hypothetical protein
VSHATPHVPIVHSRIEVWNCDYTTTPTGLEETIELLSAIERKGPVRAGLRP